MGSPDFEKQWGLTTSRGAMEPVSQTSLQSKLIGGLDALV